MSRGGTHIRRKENEFVKLWIDRNILFIEYKPDIHIDLAAVKKILNLRLRFQNGKAYPVICFINGVIGFDKQASDYTAIFGLILISAISYVAVHVLPMVLLYFYLYIYKPQIPSQLTTSIEEAIKFLTPYIRCSKNPLKPPS